MSEVDFVKDPVKAEIVPSNGSAPIEPEVRLGSLAVSNPTELVHRASELATALASIINEQKLFSIISNKRGQKNKYVKCEGWTTMGAMLGVIPVEEYCRRLENGKGFEAKIKLIRTKDGMVLGAASAECTNDESNWSGRDSYSLRSMALTRATSKAFRLSFSWIMKLAGYEATPAEEMMGQEDATVTREAVEAEVERQKEEHTVAIDKQKQQPATSGGPCLFYTIPPSHNGHFAEFLNIADFGSKLTDVAHQGLLLIFKPYIARETKSGTALVSTSAGKLDVLLAELEKVGARTKKLEAK